MWPVGGGLNSFNDLCDGDHDGPPFCCPGSGIGSLRCLEGFNVLLEGWTA